MARKTVFVADLKNSQQWLFVHDGTASWIKKYDNEHRITDLWKGEERLTAAFLDTLDHQQVFMLARRIAGCVMDFRTDQFPFVYYPASAQTFEVTRCYRDIVDRAQHLPVYLFPAWLYQEEESDEACTAVAAR